MRLLLSLAPVLGLSFNVCTHVATYRYRFTKSMLKAVYAGFFMGLLALIILNVCILSGLQQSLIEDACQILLSVVTYGILSYGYFHFNNLGETARRIRIMREFIESDGMSFEELLLKYNAKEMMRLRLGRLERAGQIIISEDGQVSLNANFVLGMARVIVLLKTILLRKNTSDYIKKGL